ncbi:MAG: hypothetical protein K2X82_20415 [Gemmataceae bacterium]|nr:hypothetical protein [Gemmataceae bacterium]
MEFTPDWCYQNNPFPAALPVYYPAQKALIGAGPLAARSLVDEYVRFFENDRPEAWAGRYTLFSLDLKTGKPCEKQHPCFRLSCIARILVSSREMAQAAVAHAAKRRDAGRGNERTLRACRELIDRVIKQFPEEKRRELFPDAFPSA